MGSLTNLRVAVYARYSSDQQRDTSIEDQIHICHQFIEDNGGTMTFEMTYTDKSVSAASIIRQDFDRLYALVRQSPAGVDVIVTENTDRISRDIGDADRFYKHVVFSGVRLLCIKDGIDSDKPGAKLQYTMRSIIADMYLADLRDKTMRGLEGQARRGFSTGGLPFGYAGQPVVGQDGKPDGSQIVVNPEAAKLVVRVFTLYRDGFSYRLIAKILNDEGVPPPRAHTKHRRKGWIASTIREFLQNEAYIGRWTYNKRAWRKLPGTNCRRPKARPADEVQRFERPHLRIVEQELWDAVRVRRKAVKDKYTKGVVGKPGRRTNFPLSGLLVCGSCGAPMVIAGGSPNRIYRCGDAHKRGTCANRSVVREDVVRKSIFAELRVKLLSANALVNAQMQLANRLEELNGGRDAKEREAEEKLNKIEGKVQRLLTLFMDDGRDDNALRPVKESLQALLVEQARQERDLAALRASATQNITLPTSEDVYKLVADLEQLAMDNPIQAREALSEFFKDGHISIECQPDGTVVGRSKLLPLVAFDRAQKKKPQQPSGSGALIVYRGGCAGAINPLYTEYEVPFEARVRVMATA